MVAVGRSDHVILPRGHEAQRHRQLAEPVGDGCDAIHQQRPDRGQRRTVVRHVVSVGIGDVRALPRRHLEAVVEQVVDHRQFVVMACPGERVDGHGAGDGAVFERCPQREGGAHALPDHDDTFGAADPRRDGVERPLRLGRPVVPPHREQIVDHGAMTGQQGGLHVIPGVDHGVGNPADRERTSREAVHDEHTGLLAPVMRDGLAPGHHDRGSAGHLPRSSTRGAGTVGDLTRRSGHG